MLHRKRLDSSIMAWGSGKNKRTLRSLLSSRNEGILVLKESFEESEWAAKGTKTNEVVYSLGKQNRWLIPEMLKDASNLRSNLGDEDILFVERENETYDRTGRADCMSVYESASGKVWKPKGKYGHVDSLLGKANKTRVVYEVTYHNTRSQGMFTMKSQKSSTKMHHSKKRGKGRVHLDKRDWQLFTEDFQEEDYDDDDCHDEDDSICEHAISLGDFISDPQNRVKANNTPRIKKSYNTESDSEVIHSTPPLKSKVIIIDDEKMRSQHNRMHALSRKTDSLLRKLFWESNFYWGNKSKTRYYRRILRKVHAESLDEEHQGEEEPMTLKREVPTLVSPPYKASIWTNNLKVSELKATWRDMYQEGASSPRKFAINVSHKENCLSNHTGLSSAFILFELNSDWNNTTTHCQASIKLLLNSELSNDKVPEESTKLIITDFCDLTEKSSDIMKVKEIVELAVKCIKKNAKENCTKPGIGHHTSRSLSVSLYENILGFKGQFYTEKEALEQIKREVLENTKQSSVVTLPSAVLSTECGICFEDLTGKADSLFTAMNSCGHSFCNDCWKSYLETRLDGGHVDLLCPGHSCKSVVDLVTIMSIAPCYWEKYLIWKVKRAMESNPSWKYCPGGNCNLVCKATPLDSSCNGALPSFLPVSCHRCSSIWCFDCQEQAHWPATCDEAQKFRAANRGYSKAKRGTQLSEIRSVPVKKCPKCQYPIEKFDGCDHMYCIMCSNEFCWKCLQSYDFVENDDDDYFDYMNVYNHHNSCQESGSEVRATKVEISISKTDVEKFSDEAVESFHAVKSGISLKTSSKFMAMEKGLEAYSFLKNHSKTFSTSHTSLTLEKMLAVNVPHVLREAYHFELQCNIGMEGMLIHLVLGSSDEVLHEHCMRLMFILEKVRAFLDNTDLLHKEGNVVVLNEMIANGQKCLMDLARHVERK